MHILITGATGFIGYTLVSELLKTSHKLTALSRSAEKQRIKRPQVNWVTHLAQVDFNHIDAIINLAGEPIFYKSWTTKQKKCLTQSRVDLTQTLSEKIITAKKPPKVFISGSATGYYGEQNEHQLTEQSPPTDNFTGQLCQQWENAALKAQSEQTRVCLLRTGLVLDKNGGALAQMLPFYRLGLGGKLGNGQQFWAWISLQDIVRAILFLLENETCQGAFNLVSPTPLQNTDFNNLLGQHLNRPTFFHVPAFLLKFILGERACLLLDSQQIIPKRLSDAGFKFDYPTLTDFLQHHL
ncbi:MAG: TIGR01777 family oxidoreductase [Lonepinella koalarum]|nr:TIGR01777 family oxidoreductase [Lonepinella koalarum]